MVIKYRNDSLLRQDIIFACCLSLIALEGIKGNISPVADMTDEEKKTTLGEFQIKMNEIKNNLNVDSIGIGDILARFVEHHGLSHVEKYEMNKASARKRLAKITAQACHLCEKIFLDFFKTTIKSHKFVLILFEIASQLNEEGCYIPEFYEELFEPFLLLEAAQDMNFTNGNELSNEDWLNLKKSAAKQARKYINDFRNNGYFLK